MSSPAQFSDPEVQRAVADAAITRNLAEAAKLRQEAAVAAQEERRKLAEAQTAEYTLETVRISTEATKRQEQLALQAHHLHHEFHFIAGVHEESVEACVTQMAIWHRQNPTCPMTIKIDSPGGSVIDGLHLFDEITSYSLREWDTRENIPKGTHPTTMIVRGYAASMAGILLQSADTRIAGPESFLMIHEVSSFAQGNIGAIKDKVKFLDKVSERVVDIFVRRAGGKITEDKFKEQWDRQDWWLTAEEAFELGFVDRIA